MNDGAARRFTAAVAALLGILGVELAGRSVARASLLAAIGIDAGPLALVAVAVLATIAALAWLQARGAFRGDRAVALVLVCAFSAGMAAQLRLGARLQSDGFYYFAHLRSLWFDGDHDLANDYRMLGLGDKAHLFVPTPTGHAQTAWAIGPALAWAPFFAVGDRVAHALRARGREVSVDGTSFPYRQAACVAGLFWGLVGLYFCYRATATVTSRGWASTGLALVAGGSFILWYLVKEPTMSHAPSMASVALFVWIWARTRGRRTTAQWALLGLAAGIMGTLRWQNVLFVILPAIEWTIDAGRHLRRRVPAPRAGADAETRHLVALVRDGVVFALAAVIGLLPQIIAWKAIYGAYFAVSPISPQIRLWDSHFVDVLWSSRNGLFATSPVLYAGAIGLVLMWRRDRLVAGAALAAFSIMAFLNGAVQDWWGSAAYGGRRFDSTIPLLVAGTAVIAQDAVVLFGRRPQLAVGLAGAALIAWNLTFMEAALNGGFRVGEPVSFSDVAGRQATTFQRWVGHPFSYPLNLLFAVRNGVSPSMYDVLWGGRLLSDPGRQYARVEIGELDDAIVGEGWHAPERQGPIAFRWADAHARIRLALNHAAPLRLYVRAHAFNWPGAPPQTVTLVVNGQPQPPLPLSATWDIVEQVVPADAWHAGINDVLFAFARANRPADVGISPDGRSLAAAVDYVRLIVVD